MALISTTEQARQYVNINFINENASLPNITRAERRFIKPILGDTLYETMLAYTSGDNDKDALLALIRQALAPLAYWLELPTLHAELTESGLRTFANDNYQPAHRWEYEEVKAQLEEDGCWGIEYLLEYLIKNKTTFSWDLPDKFKSLFSSADDFNTYYTLQQPFRTYQSLRPIIQQIVDQYITTSIGDEFYEELRSKTSPNTEETVAIDLLKKAVANLTIMRAVAVLSVKFGADGFTVTLGSNTEKPAQGQQNSTDNQLSLLMRECERTGETYLMRLKEYLNKNASNSLFTTYKDSEYYSDPTVTKTDINETLKGGFVM